VAPGPILWSSLVAVVGGCFLLVVVLDGVGGGWWRMLVASGHDPLLSLLAVDPCHLVVVIPAVGDGWLLSLLLLFQSQVFYSNNTREIKRDKYKYKFL
jgi:hypothetical protein